MCNYCELHAHDGYSLLDGIGTPAQGAQRAAELGHPFLSKTNHGSLSGVVEHMDACREVGVVPLVAVEAYYRPGRTPFDKATNWAYYHMVLTAKNAKGWRSLKLLTSEAYKSGWYRYPCIDDELLEKWGEGLIASTSCISGFVPKHILAGDSTAVDEHLAKLTRWFGEDWYFEIQPHDFDNQRTVNIELAAMAQSMGRPVVATKDAHFPWPDWADTQDISVLMRTKTSFADRDKKRAAMGDDYYDLSAPETCYIGPVEDTKALFSANHPQLSSSVVDEACRTTVEIAGRTMPFLLDKSPKLPKYRPTERESYEELRRLAVEGLRVLGHGDDPAYTLPMQEELDLYREKGFCDFFLITWDFVDWAKSTRALPPLPDGEEDPFFWATEAGGGRSKPCSIGPGRGSAGGSIVSYALRITTINPVTYELKFARFLNPHREGLPDIDLDFSPEEVGLVQEYAKRRFGRDKVYDMIAFGTFGAKAALKRVSTVFDIPFPEMNAASKVIDRDQNEESLFELRKTVRELERYFDKYPMVEKHAARLQGQISSIGEHAAAVVLSSVPLAELMPVMKKSVKDDYLVTAFGNAAATETVSKLGFLKVDFLVIVELAKHAYARELIRRYHGEDVDINALPVMEDPFGCEPEVMRIFQEALMGVFQFSGSNKTESITKKVAPENMNHLSAINALVRPAVQSSGATDDYIERRHDPSKIDYWDPAVEESLRGTLGVMLYQEQVMDIFERLGGFSPARADDVRRIMSKYYRVKGNVAEQMLGAHKEDFISAASEICAGGRRMADFVWNFNGGFCEYSFNKSHADEYSLMGYQDAWLKTHYPEAFYASLLSFPPAKIKKPEQRKPFYEKIVREARTRGVEILPPDVNDSDESFTITKDGLRFGLSSIKGLGATSVSALMAARPFASMAELVEATETKGSKFNAGHKRALGAAGALDRFNARDDMTEDERADSEEKAIGIVLSRPDRIGPMRDALRSLCHTQAEVEEAHNGQQLVVGGEVIGGREVSTRKGPSLKLEIAFGADEYRVSVAPWNYTAEIRELIDADVPLVVRGSWDSSWSSVQVDQISRADEVLEMFAVS